MEDSEWTSNIASVLKIKADALQDKKFEAQSIIKESKTEDRSEKPRWW